MSEVAQSLHRVLAAARTQGKRTQHGKPHGVVRDDQPDAREGRAGRPHSWLVTPIGRNSQINSEFYVYDLQVNPEELSALDEPQLNGRLNCLPKPVRRPKSNGCPILMPSEDAPDIAVARGLGMEELERRVALLNSTPDLRDRLVSLFEAGKQEKEISPYVEGSCMTGSSP